MFGRHMTLLALKKPGVQNYFSLVRPNTGESYFDVEVRSQTEKNTPDSSAESELDCHSDHKCTL